MTNTSEDCCCARAAARRGQRAAPGLLALSLGLAALVPKCPMCLVAYLSLAGIGAELAAAALPYLRPASYLLATLAVGMLLLGSGRWGRLARQRASSK